VKENKGENLSNSAKQDILAVIDRLHQREALLDKIRIAMLGLEQFHYSKPLRIVVEFA